MLSILLILSLGASGGLHGTVRADPSGEPVPYASVVVPELGRGVRADGRGYYVLTGLPAGRHQVVVSALGHETVATHVEVVDGTSTLADLRLPTRAFLVEPVEVRADPAHAAQETGPGTVVLDRAAIRALPSLAEPDVFRAVQTLPSVAAVSDYSTAIYLRGGTPDQTLISLDGAPLVNPYHLAGLFSAVDPDAIAAVEVQSGALAASAGDRLSGLVQIRTREGGRDRFRTSGGVSLVSSRASVDGPLFDGAGSVLVSVRRTYIDLATKATKAVGLTEESFPYAFTDAHVKLTRDLGTSGSLSLSGYVNDEGFRMPSTLDLGRVDWNWGSRAGSARLRQTFGGAWLLDARAAYSRFSADLFSDESGGQVAWNEMDNALVGAELTRYVSRHRISTGFEANALRLHHRIPDRGGEGIERFLPPMDRTDRPRTLAAFVTDEWTPSTAFGARVGVRVLHVEGGTTVAMPRGSARVGLGRGVSLVAGGGRYAQAIRSLRDEEALVASLFAYDLFVAADPQRIPTSRDAVVGLDWSAGATRLRGDLFRRTTRDLPVAPIPTDALDAPALVPEDTITATAVVQGMELLVRHQAGRGAVTAAYTLSRNLRTQEGLTFTPRYHRTHLLDLSGVLQLGGAGQATSRVTLASGQPYTPVEGRTTLYVYDPRTGAFYPIDSPVVYGPHNTGRLPAYFRVDLGVRRSYERRMFGHQGTLTPYFQVINAAASRNVLWAMPYVHGAHAELEYAPQLPVLPTFGFEWRF